VWNARVSSLRRKIDQNVGGLYMGLQQVQPVPMARSVATTTGVKLDSRTRARLKALSRIRQRSQHWLMKEAIERYLDREESSEQMKRETLERWERYETTGDHISDKTIEAWLESWGTEHEGRRPQPGA